MLTRILFFSIAVLFSNLVSAQSISNVAGQYKAILQHEGTDFYQYAQITLRTINPSGEIKISANVRVFFGEADSNEYLTYEFDDVPLNLLTRQISVQSENNDVSMIGFLKDGTISGEWFSTLIGYVGIFSAQKGEYPEVPLESQLVKSLSGHYRGTLTNENPDSSLPERLTFSFVTTQDNASGQPSLHVTGNTRLYLGEFGSQEYVELIFTDIQFNYYNRFLTAKTKQYGLTFRGYLDYSGNFNGELFSDAVGRVGPVALTKSER
jgi:hypothetical protein